MVLLFMGAMVIKKLMLLLVLLACMAALGIQVMFGEVLTQVVHVDVGMNGSISVDVSVRVNLALELCP